MRCSITNIIVYGTNFLPMAGILEEFAVILIAVNYIAKDGQGHATALGNRSSLVFPARESRDGKRSFNM